MRVALCITGHFRNFDASWPWLKKHIIDIYNPDIFAHAWTESLGIHQLVFDKSHPSTTIGYNPASPAVPKFYVDSVVKVINPKILITENQNDVIHIFNDLINQYSQYNQPWYWFRPITPFCLAYSRSKILQQKQNYEQKNRFIYDKVIFTRWDLVLEDYIPLDAINNENLIIPQRYTYGGICDMFAIGSSHQLDLYSSMIENLEKVKDMPNFNLGIHTWVKCHLECLNVPYQELNIPIALCNRFQL